MANEQSDESRPAEVQATVLSRIPLSIGGRSGYSCNYVFPVDEEQHTGSDRADSYLLFGKTAVVDYNSQDPTMSALD